jgi:Mechanosensitive ion channel
MGAQLARHQLEPPMHQLIVRVTRVIVMRFALVVALDKLGFQIAPLVAGIGVAGLGIGFALKACWAISWRASRSSSPSRSAWASTSPSRA